MPFGSISLEWKVCHAYVFLLVSINTSRVVGFGSPELKGAIWWAQFVTWILCHDMWIRSKCMYMLVPDVHWCVYNIWLCKLIIDFVREYCTCKCLFAAIPFYWIIVQTGEDEHQTQFSLRWGLNGLNWKRIFREKTAPVLVLVWHLHIKLQLKVNSVHWLYFFNPRWMQITIHWDNSLSKACFFFWGEFDLIIFGRMSAYEPCNFYSPFGDRDHAVPQFYEEVYLDLKWKYLHHRNLNLHESSRNDGTWYGLPMKNLIGVYLNSLHCIPVIYPNAWDLENHPILLRYFKHVVHKSQSPVVTG